jgi:hypothetical protein
MVITMKHISVKLSDEDYVKVTKQRGARTTSEYVRDLLFLDQKTHAEASNLEGLFADVSAIRIMIETAIKNNVDQRGGRQ